MKKINLMIAGAALVYVVLFLFAGVWWKGQTARGNREYLVEINRIIAGMEETGSFSMPDLRSAKYIEEVSFLSGDRMKDTDALRNFFRNKNGKETHIEPLMAGDGLQGMIRFDYRIQWENPKIFWFVEGIITISCLFILTILVYIRNRVLKPFLTLSNLPYELSKGRLQTEVEENKDRFFGKFVWGISMLRDTLRASQEKTLELEKEKKMMLLSLSHDIKTPLSSIKLYAKALQEDLYDMEEKKKQAAGQIGKLAGDIEAYVKEIIKTSHEEIIPIEVKNTEFYLKDLVELIKEYYEPKCRLIMTEFTIGDYRNKLIRGDMDRAFEAVGNIMENAFKYGDGKKITISFYEEEYCQLIRIKNTGEPVRSGEMTKLFDGFFRGSNAGTQEGNGLGLYICREIMRKMDGEIFAGIEEDGMNFQLVFAL